MLKFGRSKVCRMKALVFFVFVFASCSAYASFDVRQHLSTKTTYGAATAIMDRIAPDHVLPSPHCAPIHLNLVARHGTRAPTKKRIKELDRLAERLRVLAASSLQAPAWMTEWRSPWKGRNVGGELLIRGEEEMFHLGKRVLSKFEEIFRYDYHPDRYLISATQVPRSAASAVAFGMGLFAGKGTLGPGLHRAFSVTSESRQHDTHLRFFETCQNYKDYKAKRIPVVATAFEEVHAQIAASLVERFKLNLTIHDISSLWFLCKEEAALLDILDRACGLFTQEEVELLEWVDDVELHHLKGYGESINYRMGIPLLENVFKSMEEAILAADGTSVSNSIERAHLRFAHGETIVPFICLLGLFLDEKDVQKVLNEQPIEPPAPPPKPRLWRGSAIAPYGANTNVVLYKCSVSNEKATEVSSATDFFVQIFHNEKSMALPACNGTHICPFTVFKERVVIPHLKHSYESLCTAFKADSRSSWTSQLQKLGSRFFQSLYQKGSCEDKSEL